MSNYFLMFMYEHRTLKKAVLNKWLAFTATLKNMKKIEKSVERVYSKNSGM